MKTKKEISIIILAYFHEKYIERAIESVLNQKYEHEIEIIIADDCSTDNTISISEKYMNNYPNIIRVIKHDNNVGTCENLYKAFLESRGKYILIMAGDDYLCDINKISKQYDFLENQNHSDYVAVCTPIKTVFTDGVATNKVFPGIYNKGKEVTISEFLEGFNYPDQGILMRNIFNNEKARQQFSLMPKFSKYIEDLTLNFFLYDYGRVYMIPDITYALTVRRENDINQHNYNSIRNQLDKVTDHIILLNNLYKFYDGKYDMQKRYSQYIASSIVISLKQKKPYCIKLLKNVPKKYIIPSCFDYLKLWRRSHR